MLINTSFKKRKKKENKTMYSSGVWIEHLENGGIKIGVTDYYVSEFGDSDWEWSVSLNKDNKELLIKALKCEFEKELSLKEMIVQKFGNNLNTIDFASYLDNLNIDYIVERSC